MVYDSQPGAGKVIEFDHRFDRILHAISNATKPVVKQVIESDLHTQSKRFKGLAIFKYLKIGMQSC